MPKSKTVKAKKPKKTTVKFVFDNQKTADHFIGWICEMGEQDYWQYMEYREDDEDGDITGVDFDYWGGTEDGNEFGAHDIIVKSGRITKPHGE